MPGVYSIEDIIIVFAYWRSAHWWINTLTGLSGRIGLLVIKDTLFGINGYYFLKKLLMRLIILSA